MKNLLFILVILFSQCTTTPVPGILWSSTTEHVKPSGTLNSLGSGRIIYKAESCQYNTIFLYFIYSGSITNPYTIAREAGIQKIGVVDYSSFNILGPLLFKTCTIVWGDKE